MILSPSFQFSLINKIIIVSAVILQGSIALVRFENTFDTITSTLYDEYDFAVPTLSIPSYGSRIYVSIPDASAEIAKNIIVHDYVRDETSLYDISKMKNGNEKGYYEVEIDIQQVIILNMNPGNATAPIAVWVVHSNAQDLECSKVYDADNLNIVPDWQPSASLTVMSAEPFTLRSNTEGKTKLYTTLTGFDRNSHRCTNIFYQMDPNALNDIQVYVQSPLISLSFDVLDYTDTISTVRADVGIGNLLDFSGMSFVASPGYIGCNASTGRKNYRSSIYSATTSFEYSNPTRAYDVDISSVLNTDAGHPVTLKDSTNGKEFTWYGTSPDNTNSQNITLHHTNNIVISWTRNDNDNEQSILVRLVPSELDVA